MSLLGSYKSESKVWQDFGKMKQNVDGFAEVVKLMNNA